MKNHTDNIAVAEAHEQARAALASKAADTLAAAQEAKASAAQAHKSTTSHSRDLAQRLMQGDSTVSAADMLAADADEKRTSALLDSAKRRLATAERGVVHLDSTLAETVAPVVADVLPGVEVLCITGKTVPAPVTTPVVFIAQVTPDRADVANGTVAGEVHVHYFRSPLHSALTPQALQVAADKAGTRAAVYPGPRTNRGTTVVDVVQVEVKAAWPETPTIASVHPWRVDALRQSVEQDVATAFSTSSDRRVGIRAGASGDATRRTSGVATTATAELRGAETTRSDGTRSVTVDIACRARRTERAGYPWTTEEMAAKVRDYVDSLPGTYAPGLGRVERVEGAKFHPVPQGCGVEASVAFVSRAA